MLVTLEKCCHICTLSVVAHTRQRGSIKMAEDSMRRRTRSHGIPESEQEAQERLLGQQWLGTSVMRGCFPLCLQWIWGTSQWCLSFGSPPFRGHFCPLQWLFCPFLAFFFFVPTFNPSSLLLFLPPLSVSIRKQNKVETTTVHSPHSPAGFHYGFSPDSAFAQCALHYSLYMWLLFVTASETFNRGWK